LNQGFSSLQVSLNKRFTHGLNNQLSYTWSKNIDYFSSNAQMTSNAVPDPFNFFRFRGPADFDHRQRFVDALVYQIRDAGHALGSPIASAGLGNWPLSAIAQGRGAEIAHYFNTSAVTQAPAGTYGNLGRTSLVGLGYLNADASLSRSVRLPLGDAGKPTFRAEAFNLLNRPELANPGTKVAFEHVWHNRCNLGGAPRIVQFSLKILF